MTKPVVRQSAVGLGAVVLADLLLRANGVDPGLELVAVLAAVAAMHRWDAVWRRLTAPRNLLFVLPWAAVGAVCGSFGEGPSDGIGRFAGALLCFVLLGYALLGWMDAARQGQPAATPRAGADSWWAFAGVALMVAYSLVALWLRSYYPSGTSPDTLNQWQQVHGEIPYSDVHALGHTILLKLLLSLWDSYAVVVLAQILMVAFLYGIFAKYLYEKRVEYTYILLGTWVFLLFCNTGANFLYMYPLKDTPYTFALGIVCYFIMRSLDGDYPFTPTRALALGAALAAVPLMRHNGIVPALGCGVYFAVCLLRRRERRGLAVAAAAAAACVLAVSLVGYGVLKAESPANGFSVQLFGAGVSAVLAKDGAVSAEQMAQAAEILPVEWIKEHYEPWHPERLLWTRETGDVFNNRYVLAMGEHPLEVVGLYLRLLPANLGIMAAELAYGSQSFWGIAQPWDNAALLLALGLALFGCWNRAAFRRRWPVLLPVALNALSILVSAVTPEPRYYLPTATLFVPLLLCICFACFEQNPVPTAYKE